MLHLLFWIVRTATKIIMLELGKEWPTPFLEKYISNHPKFWEIWELFQMAADGCRVVENESWKGPHPDHDNLKFMDKDFWKLTENPIGRNFIGVCYIRK